LGRRVQKSVGLGTPASACQNVMRTLQCGRQRYIFPGRPAESGGNQLPEKGVISPDELLSALKRYLEESGDTEQAVASKIGVNHHTLQRWLSDNQSPKRGGGKLALTALFLRRAGYL
jgi:hypothetical protein